MVEIPREREDAAHTDAPVGGLKSHHAAQRSGDADRAARVGAERRQRHAAGHRRRAAARGPARDAVRVPRVAAIPEVRVDVGHAQRDLVRVGLAEQNRARSLEFSHGDGILLGHEVREVARSRRGADARRVVQVLDGDGNTR